MGMKEKMMNNMIDGMSSEEKKAMMEQMMDQFLGSLTDEEKQDMMNTMMPRMMEQMMGEGGNPMAGMMQMMMGGGHQGKHKGSNPMDMCREMMTGFASPEHATSTVTPEIGTLYSEWKQQLEDELLSAIKEKSLHTVDEIAAHMNLSRESVIYFLASLAQQDKLKLEVAGS